MRKQTEAGDLPGREGAVGLQLQQKEEDSEVLFPECQLSKLMNSIFPHLYTLNPLSTLDTGTGAGIAQVGAENIS